MNKPQIPLSSPDLSDEDREVVLDVLRGSILSIGPRVVEFEELIAQRADRRHAVAVSSGTAALHLIVRALGWQDGAEVITTPFSFVASANCLLYERVRPVFVDIDPETRCIDPNRVEQAVTARTVGILSVDVFGFPADWNALEEIATRRGLALVTDSCESIGTTRQQGHGLRIPAGKAGAAGAFAFYPNKQVTTGEGGAIVTDDHHLAGLCRSMRNQGRDAGAGWLQHARLGYNYRLSEMAAALGTSQMRRLDGIVEMRQQVAARYRAMLAPFAELIELPPEADGIQISWFVYVVRLANHFTRSDRDRILAGLHADGVSASAYFSPVHLQPYIAHGLGHRAGDFPVTEQIADRAIALPFYTRLDSARQSRVVECLVKHLTAVRPVAASGGS